MTSTEMSEHELSEEQPRRLYMVKDGNRNVATFSALPNAIDLCSRRHYFVEKGAWRNLGNEMRFDDYTIVSFHTETFPAVEEVVSFAFYPYDRYSRDIERALAEKSQISD